MRFALLGADIASLALAGWIGQRPEHRVSLVCETHAADGVLRGLAPDARALADWELLLAGTDADVVMVAAAAVGEADRRVDQLRKLIQAGVPLLVSHPVCTSMLDCHELDMIRRETGCIVVPFAPESTHPALELLAHWLTAADRSPLGQIEQILMDRAQSDRSEPAVIRQFARDVLLLRTLIGEVQRVGALGSSSQSLVAYANLTLQMTGESEMLARWTVQAVENQPGAWLTLLGTQGKARLWMPAHGTWELTLPGESEPQAIEPEWQAEQAAIESLQAAMAGEPVTPDWAAAARAVEVAEAVPRSLARGRTIELHREVFSEAGTFKGTMTSAGCGLLMAAIMTLFVGNFAHTMLLKAHKPEAARIVNYCWIGALVVLTLLFLALQFLLPLAQRGDAAAADHRADDSIEPTAGDDVN